MTVDSLAHVVGDDPDAKAGAPAPFWPEAWRVLVLDGGWWCMICTLSSAVTSTALDTLTTPLATDRYGWAPIEISGLFAAWAFAGLLGAVVSSKAAKRGVAGRKMLLVGLTTVSCGGE